MRRPVARRPWVRIGIGAVLVCVLPLSACVPNIRLLSARIEVAEIESLPAEYQGWPQDGAQSSRPRKSLNGVRELPAYDLRTVTDDICIEVRGGNMLGQTIRSNRLRVSAKTQ